MVSPKRSISSYRREVLDLLEALLKLSPGESSEVALPADLNPSTLADQLRVVIRLALAGDPVPGRELTEADRLALNQAVIFRQGERKITLYRSKS